MDKKICSVPGCDRPFLAKRSCSLHYERLRRGTPLEAPVRLYGTIADRFWPKVRKSDGCWEWTARKNPHGYGVLGRRDGGSRLAHRIAYELTHGEVPADLDVDHMCRNPGCVNPEHLRSTTRAENEQNRSGATRKSKSGLRGVRKLGNRWQARAQLDKKFHHIGYYATPEEAAIAASDWRRANMPYSEMDKEEEVA